MYTYSQSAWKLIFFGQVDDATGGRAKQVPAGCLPFSDNDIDDSNIGDFKKSAKVRIRFEGPSGFRRGAFPLPQHDGRRLHHLAG